MNLAMSHFLLLQSRDMVLRNFIRYGNFKAGTDGRVHLGPHGCAVVGSK